MDRDIFCELLNPIIYCLTFYIYISRIAMVASIRRAGCPPCTLHSRRISFNSHCRHTLLLKMQWHATCSDTCAPYATVDMTVSTLAVARRSELESVDANSVPISP
ncbi:hypothetical protein BT96DRAFT_228757 [Gymnopus androsaceus JB14]|uniref:Uncharacterized protein n=1 Tax=Gymnopus androsaceus JB14 TaxID=1447944 RepID=A0A6A4H7S5_9AGAR|nr:hypothetical protein BT96DRAFT_228757 [Gymnopus androsaceus JB14]